MAFRIKPDGTVEADSIEEFQQLVKLRADATPARPATSLAAVVATHPDQDHVGSEQAWRNMYDSLHDPKQQKLLRILAQSRNGLTDAEVRQWLGLKTNVELRGLLIGIATRARNQGLRRPLKKQVSRVNGGKDRTYRYALSNGLLLALKKGGVAEQEEATAQ